MSSNAFNELAREYNEREDRLEEIRERLRCPNACTEPCDYPACRCHQGKVSEADLDKAIAGAAWADTRTQAEIEAAARAAVCEAYADDDYSRHTKESPPMRQDPPPSTTWTDYILVALIAVGLGFAYVYWVVEEPAVAFTGEVAR